MPSMSRLSTLTPSRSPSPTPPIVQPDHFYGSETPQAFPSPNSDRRVWLSPDDDPLAHRGIPVFKPTLAEFEDFEGYMQKVECWGMRSGVIKIIPPKEWTDALPSIIPQLREVKIGSPIEQHMLGRGGLFRQENLEKRKFMSVREWVELCNKEDFRAPGVHDVGLGSRSANGKAPATRSRRVRRKTGTVKTESAGPDVVIVKEEPMDDSHQLGEIAPSDPMAITRPSGISGTNSSEGRLRQPKNVAAAASINGKPKTRSKRQTKEQKEATHARDLAFVDGFNPHQDWLPPDTKPSDYTSEFCQKLERTYWRNLGLGKPAWYGADTQGSLFTDETKSWNVAHLPSTLSRLLPASDKGLPGVNTPYLYFGMWRATFAWHVEDMDLFSINYIHFGAPKFWYAIPQGRANALENTMRGYFPKDTSQCPQFLRHKSFLASPNILAQSSCRPNFLVQHAGEFVITFPRGYHAGLNLGLNCAESVNFALDSWIEIGRKAKACKCISDSVRIDVDQLLQDRALEAQEGVDVPATPISNAKKQKSAKSGKAKTIVKKEELDSVLIPPLPTSRTSRKRKADGGEGPTKTKKIKVKTSPVKNSASSLSSTSRVPPKPLGQKISVTLKLPARPAEIDIFPCCLCISPSNEGLLHVYDPPIERRDAVEATGNPKVWMAHEQCARVVPETWVDEVEGKNGAKEKVVFGVDAIVRDRWNLKCSACTRNKPKAHGAPVQCTKGKCPKAFHVSCAQNSSTLVFEVLREVEKEVILMDPNAAAPTSSFAGVPMENTVRTDQVLKVVKKLEVQILCTQHNPAIAAEKKANKQEKIKKELLALPSMSRIKIRVSAGVFEVSLVRVIEETGSVEVLWDRGLKKEFKWGSVVFGSTDGPVHQKPSEPAPDPQAPQANPPESYSSIPLRPPIPSTSSSQAIANTTTSPPSTSFSVPYYSSRPGYNYWPYGASQTSYTGASTQYPYPYSGYYTSVPLNGNAQFTPYVHNQNQYRGGQLQWQQPYQGPRQGFLSTPNQQVMDGQPAGFTQVLDPSVGLAALSNSATHPPGQAAAETQNQGTPQCQPTPPSSTHLPMSSTKTSTSPAQTSQPSASPAAASTGGTLASQSAPVPPDSSQQGFVLTAEIEQAILTNLHALSIMQPSHLAELLQSNPQLQAVLAAMNQAKPAASS